MVHSIFGRAGEISLRLCSRNSAQKWVVELVWWENGLCCYCTTHTHCYICTAAKNSILSQPSLSLLLATLCPMLPLKVGPLWHQMWPILSCYSSKSESHVSFPDWQILGHWHVSNCKEGWEKQHPHSPSIQEEQTEWGMPLLPLPDKWYQENHWRNQKSLPSDACDHIQYWPLTYRHQC